MNVVFHKPCGVVSQFTPLGGHKTLSDFGLPPKIYPCGRLDQDSEGLIVLSDDGNLISRMIEPRYETPRTYWAQVEGLPAHDSLFRLSQGLVLKDGKTKPCQARLLEIEPDLPPRQPPIRFRKNIPTAWIELTLTEGKNRQVRRMTAAVGHPTLRLVRISHGPFTLEGLEPGEWKAT